MLNSDQSLWHSFRNLLQRVGHYMYTHFKHVTHTVRYVADRLHNLNIGPLSQVAHLVSKGTTIADSVFDYAHELYGMKPPNPPDWTRDLNSNSNPAVT